MRSPLQRRVHRRTAEPELYDSVGAASSDRGKSGSLQRQVAHDTVEDLNAAVRCVKILGMPEGIEVDDVRDAFGHGVCVERVAVRGTVAWLELASAAEAQRVIDF